MAKRPLESICHHEFHAQGVLVSSDYYPDGFKVQLSRRSVGAMHAPLAAVDSFSGVGQHSTDSENMCCNRQEFERSSSVQLM